MFDVKNLSRFLIVDNISNNIFNNNEKEFELSHKLLDFTENSMFTEINNHSVKTPEEDTINAVVILLFVQGIKSYKSSLILCLNGYYTNAILNTRNIIETIFNIMYLFETPEESYKRANNYLNSVSKWTDETIKNRAYLSYNSTLYNLYRLTSDYTHSNYIATSQNFNEDDVLSSFPAETKADEAIVLINSIYYYLIEYLCEHYGIDFSSVEHIKKSKAFKKRYKTYKMFNFARRYYDD